MTVEPRSGEDLGLHFIDEWEAPPRANHDRAGGPPARRA
jgi:hypothetical protein